MKRMNKFKYIFSRQDRRNARETPGVNEKGKARAYGEDERETS